MKSVVSAALRFFAAHECPSRVISGSPAEARECLLLGDKML